jgi:small subunit ribosomal protein S1
MTDAFGDMLDSRSGDFRKGFDPGERIRGIVSAIDEYTVFVDIGARSEGLLSIEEVRDKQGALTVEEGQEVAVFFANERNGEIHLTTKISGDSGAAEILDAYEAGIPVEGKVEEEVKGGFRVSVGSHRGFCPFSQMDTHSLDAGVYIGQKFLFEIAECDERLRNLVLNRRRLLEKRAEEQKKELRETLEPGMVVEGTVRNIVDFGVFVDIGGMDGLVPLGELAWGRKVDPEDVVKIGDTVSVMVRDIDWDRERIALSLRYAEGNPWDTVGDKYVKGRHVLGTVVKLMPFGAFVELEPGIEGLLHISKIGGGRRINHPREELDEGQQLDVVVENVDIERERISLSLDTKVTDDDFGAPDEPQGEEGQAKTGVIDGVRDFGVFVKLPDGRTGLLHVSQIDIPENIDRQQYLGRNFTEGSEIDVVIQGIDGDRISLTTPEKWQEKADTQSVRERLQDNGGKEFGSIGSVFDNLKL